MVEVVWRGRETEERMGCQKCVLWYIAGAGWWTTNGIFDFDSIDVALPGGGAWPIAYVYVREWEGRRNDEGFGRSVFCWFLVVVVSLDWSSGPRVKDAKDVVVEYGGDNYARPPYLRRGNSSKVYYSGTFTEGISIKPRDLTAADRKRFPGV